MSYVAVWELVESKKKSRTERIPDKSLYFLNKASTYNLENINGPIYKFGRPLAEGGGSIYVKGTLFVRMLASVMGEHRFQRAMRSYLNKYKFSNVDHEQLWDSLEEENPFNGTSMATVFNTWIKQEGFPSVSVSRCYIETCKNQITFKQTRYNSTSYIQTSSELEQLWYIPISYATITFSNDEMTMTETNHGFVMPPTKQEVVHELENALLDSEFAIIVNINHTGMYRVTYDERNWKAIRAVLMKNPHIIPQGTRLQLVDELQRSLVRKEINESLVLCIGEYTKVYCCNKYLSSRRRLQQRYF